MEQRERERNEGRFEETLALGNEIAEGTNVADKIEAELLNLDWTDDEIGLFPMAVKEAIMNAIVYGNLGVKRERSGNDAKDNKAYDDAILAATKDERNKEKRVIVSIDLTPEMARAVVTDEGEGFDFGDVPDPTEESALLGTDGRGVFLIKSAGGSQLSRNSIGFVWSKADHEKKKPAEQ